MITYSRNILLFVLIAGLSLALVRTVVAEEPAKVARKVLLKQDMAISEKEAVVIAVEIPPGAEEGRHTHPAELYVVVQEGALLLESEGKEDTIYKAGEAFSVSPGRIHNGKNMGTSTAKLTALLVTEKGKPLSAPAK